MNLVEINQRKNLAYQIFLICYISTCIKNLNRQMMYNEMSLVISSFFGFYRFNRFRLGVSLRVLRSHLGRKVCFWEDLALSEK